MLIRYMGLLLMMLAAAPTGLLAAEGRVYKVAIDAEYAPYEFVDVDGKVKGMLPSLLRVIGKSAHVGFEFLPMAWPDAVAALEGGKVDLVNMIRTPGRIGKYEFSQPHSRIHQALFRNRHHQDIQGVASIAGRRVALQQYDVAVEKLADHADFDRIMIKSKEEGFLMLDAGKVVALFSAEQPGLYFLRQHELKQVELAQVNLWPQEFCFTAKKGNSAIITMLNHELDALKQSGRYETIIRPWLITPPSWLQSHQRELWYGFSLLLLLVVGFMLWSMQLRRQVRTQTRELAESERYRRALYEQSPVGLALCRMDGGMVDINPAYAAMLGRTVEETLQLTYWDITPKEYAEDEQRQLQSLQERGGYGPYEKEYLHRDGHRVPVRLNGVTLERGGECFIWSSVEDITQEQAQRNRLIDQAQEMAAVIEKSPNGILLLTENGAIRSANPALCAMFGYDEAALQRMVIHDLVPERMRQQHVELFANEVAGKTHQAIDQAREVCGQRQDGDEFPCEVTVSSFMVASKRMISVLVQDLTARKQAEKRSQQLVMMLEASPDFVGMADADGKVLYVNPAGRRMVGVAEDVDVSTMMIADFHSADESGRIAEHVLPRAAREGVCRCEVVFSHVDGEETLTSAVFMAHNLSRDGRPDIYSVIARDLTAERDMQTKIEHSQRLESLGVLAGGIAHDFNNILTAILGNAAMAERKAVKKPQDTQRYLTNIVESSEKAAELCKQMLAYSGKGKFVVKAIDLSVMVQEITRLLEVSIAKSVVLKCHLAENLPAVEADAAQMQQVIMNLVINASDAIGDRSGVISITTGIMRADSAYLAGTCLDDDLPEGRYLYLEVSDTGCGMDKATQAKVFEPFFTTKFTGHGLGMAAVLGIVRGHHGAIKLYSEPGRGTTFKLLLPTSDKSPQVAVAEMVSEDGWHGAGTVLIVDDEETIREASAMMLEDMGFATLTAVDGEDGVRVYRQHQAEIVAVLMDMTMPKMDGKACFTELRRINKDVRVVLSSGYNEQEATSQFAGQGLAGFLHKPYFPDALQARMREVLGE
ncbi:MAG: PAS domain S-box protein [Mariprofundales bacterium]